MFDLRVVGESHSRWQRPIVLVPKIDRERGGAETTLGPGSLISADLLGMLQLEEAFKRESLQHSRMAGGEGQTCTHCYRGFKPGKHPQEEDCCMKPGLPSLPGSVGHVVRGNHKPLHEPRRGRVVGRSCCLPYCAQEGC